MSWERYLDWLHHAVPDVAATLRPPAAESDIRDLERLVGVELPEAVKDGWRRHDGQSTDVHTGGDVSGRWATGAILDYWWLPIGEVAQQWRTWAGLRAETSDEDMATLRCFCVSRPAGAIRPEYTLAGWIPLFQQPLEGNYVGLDFEPGPQGRTGQVIPFGRDHDEKFVAAASIESFLVWLADQAEAGAVAATVDGRLLHKDGYLVSALERADRRPGLAGA
jgi:cell wall assembly regulator SMI1